MRSDALSDVVVVGGQRETEIHIFLLYLYRYLVLEQVGMNSHRLLAHQCAGDSLSNSLQYVVPVLLVPSVAQQVSEGAEMGCAEPHDYTTASPVEVGAGGPGGDGGNYTRGAGGGARQQQGPEPVVTLPLLCAQMLLYLLIVVVNAGIVVYERVVADIYRTLLNKVVAVMSMYNVCLSTWAQLAFSLNAVEVYPGTTLCTAHLFVIIILIQQEFLVHAEINLLCIFHFRKLRIFEMNEEFGKRLIVSVNLVVSSFFSFVLCAVLGESFFFYQICVGGSAGGFICPKNLQQLVPDI